MVKTGESIQQAISNIPPGGSILVQPGNYIENLYVSKPIQIHSKSASHIFGQIVVNASNVTLKGFTLYRLDPSSSALTITGHSSASSVLNCRIIGMPETKSLSQGGSAAAVHCTGCSQLIFVNNIIENWKYGFRVDEEGSITVQSNVFRSCMAALEIVSTSTARLIRNFFVKNLLVIQILQHKSIFVAQITAEGNVFENNLAVGTSSDGSKISLDGLNYIVGPSFDSETRLKPLHHIYGSTLQSHPSLQMPQRLHVSGSCQSSLSPTAEYCASLQALEYPNYNSDHCDCSRLQVPGKIYTTSLAEYIIRFDLSEPCDLGTRLGLFCTVRVSIPER